MAALEDLVRPGHANGNGGPEPKANHQKAAIPGPGVVEGKRNGEEAGDLNAHGGGEEDGTMTVESVGNRGDQENRAEIHL